MKKLTALILALVFGLAMLSGCEGSNNPPDENKKITIGYSTIYLSPTWQQLTHKEAEKRFNYWKENNVTDKMIVANANGDTSTQISQIDNFISQGVDAIVVIAGSPTALNPVLEKAEKQGIRVIATDGLPDTDAITCKVNTSDEDVGKACAKWVIEQIGDKGKIIIANGPAGISCAEQRRDGARQVLKDYPNIEIVTETYSEYNAGPAKQALLPVLSAHPDIDAVLTFDGSNALAALTTMMEKGMNLVPVPGENYNAFLKTWAKAKETSNFTSMAVVHPNWLGAIAVDAAVRAVKGYELPKFVKIDSVIITDEMLSDFVPNDHPDDYFCEPDITEADYVRYLGAMD